ncbi:MAG: O-antigen ligase family protein [Kiloniellales bacterium]
MSGLQAATFSLLAFVLPLVALLAPKGTVVVLFAGTLLAAAARWASERRLPRPAFAPTLLLGLMVLWMAAASLWSFDPAGGLTLALRVTASAAAGLWLIALASSLDDATRVAAGWALLVGCALAVSIVLIELLFDFPITRAFRSDSDNPYRLLSSLNRGATALALLVWPVTAVLWRQGLRKRALALPLLLLALLLFLQSSAAVFALAAGLMTALLALLHRKAGRALLLAAAAGALLLSPLVGPTLYRNGAMEWSNLDSTAKHRVHIWNFTSERILERPLFGWGFDASRDMPNFGVEPYDNRARVIPLHPHNGALQILLELGPVGGLLAFAIFWLMAERLERLAMPGRLAGQAAGVTGVAIACSAYGLWQGQWLAMLFLAAAMVILAAPSATAAPARVERGRAPAPAGLGPDLPERT